MDPIKMQTNRGDTLGIPLTITWDITSTVRVHLKQTPDAEAYFVLNIVDNSIVIPKDISSQCTGLWRCDVEITTSNDIVYTPAKYDITFVADQTSIYDPTGRLKDLERNSIVAKQFMFRKENGDLEYIPPAQDIADMVILEANVVAAAFAASQSASSALSSKNAADADVVLTHADVVLTHADVLLTHADALSTAADRLAASGFASQTEADKILTAADVLLTHADVLLTHADVLLTHADANQTALDRIATAADRVQTGLDKIATAADRVQTGLDRNATGADVILTHADVVLTHADVVLTHADAVQTALDRIQTGLDRTQTGLDRIAAAASAATALEAIGSDEIQLALINSFRF